MSTLPEVCSRGPAGFSSYYLAKPFKFGLDPDTACRLDGRTVNKQVLHFVAEPVEITGDVERQGELLILRADPAAYRRVNG